MINTFDILLKDNTISLEKRQISTSSILKIEHSEQKMKAAANCVFFRHLHEITQRRNDALTAAGEFAVGEFAAGEFAAGELAALKLNAKTKTNTKTKEQAKANTNINTNTNTELQLERNTLIGLLFRIAAVKHLFSTSNSAPKRKSTCLLPFTPFLSFLFLGSKKKKAAALSSKSSLSSETHRICDNVLLLSNLNTSDNNAVLQKRKDKKEEDEQQLYKQMYILDFVSKLLTAVWQLTKKQSSFLTAVILNPVFFCKKLQKKELLAAVRTQKKEQKKQTTLKDSAFCFRTKTVNAQAAKTSLPTPFNCSFLQKERRQVLSTPNLFFQMRLFVSCFHKKAHVQVSSHMDSELPSCMRDLNISQKYCLQKLVNICMVHGKKSKACSIITNTLYKLAREKTAATHDVIAFVTTAIDNVKPILEVKKVRISGSTQLVPSIISKRRQDTLAIRWILEAATKRRRTAVTKRNLTLDQCVFAEIVDAFNKVGTVRKKRDELHKLAEANRGFSHYRWW